MKTRGPQGFSPPAVSDGNPEQLVRGTAHARGMVLPILPRFRGPTEYWT